MLSVGTAGKNTTVRKVEGAVAPNSSPHLCVFAHFDPDGRIDDHVINYLRNLHEIGQEIVFVSTAKDLDTASLEKARQYCRAIIIRENLGYDFGSWKTGFGYCGDLGNYETVLIANDSVYGPIGDLGAKIKEMRRRKFDFWGITDSYEGYPHIQSYFIFFEKPAFQSDAFKDFWARLPLFKYKWSVIWRGEIGLSRLLTSHGLTMGALCDYKAMRRENEDLFLKEEAKTTTGRLNTSHVIWQLLIEEYGCPFLKVGIVRDLPSYASDIRNWKSFLENKTDYDATIAANHLKRIRQRTTELG